MGDIHTLLKEENLYNLLRVKEDATAKEIRRAYFDLALIYHPDKVNNTPEMKPHAALYAELFMKIQKGHETLQDEEKRKAYDGTLKAKLLKKRKEAEMDTNRKKMKEDLVRRENEHQQKKEEQRRASKTAKYSEEDTTWLKKDKPFRMPATPQPPPPEETQKTTILVKWSRKKQFTHDEIMEAFKRFGDIDLVMLRDTEGSRKGRPSAMVSFKLAASAQAAINTKVGDFKVRSYTKAPEAPKPTSSTPTQRPQQQTTPQTSYHYYFRVSYAYGRTSCVNTLTPSRPFTFTSPFGTTFPYSPAGSPFTFTSPQTQTRSVEELEDYEMQILNKMKKAAQAQKEAASASSTPAATPTTTPSSTPVKSFPSSFTTPDSKSTPNDTPNKSTPIDVDNPTASNPINVDDSTPTSTPSKAPHIIDLDSHNTSTDSTNSSLNNSFTNPLDFESVGMMKLRQAAERKKLLDELEKNAL